MQASNSATAFVDSLGDEDLSTSTLLSTLKQLKHREQAARIGQAEANTAFLHERAKLQTSVTSHVTEHLKMEKQLTLVQMNATKRSGLTELSELAKRQHELERICT